MSDLTNKISYLKGLSDGMKISEKSDEGALITKLIDALEAAAEEIEKLSARCDETDTAIEELNEENIDLNMSMDELLNYIDADDSLSLDEDDERYYGDDEDDDLFDAYDEDKDDLFEIRCPECGEDVIVDFDMLDDENNIVCPNCHHDIELEFDIDEDEDGEDSGK